MTTPYPRCPHDSLACDLGRTCDQCVDDQETELARLAVHLWTCTDNCWLCHYARTMGADLPKPADL